jgi:hypothetical protein
LTMGVPTERRTAPMRSSSLRSLSLSGQLFGLSAGPPIFGSQHRLATGLVRGRLDFVIDALRKRLLDIDEVLESPSMFGAGNGFWCNGKEIAHFDSDDVVDLRLTKAVIRELRTALREDARVELRKGSSDWVEVRVTSHDDIGFVVQLAERAAAAHRARAGEMPKLPPVGADLERRRRFH